jgi:outer membrane protein insertion porin family
MHKPRRPLLRSGLAALACGTAMSTAVLAPSLAAAQDAPQPTAPAPAPAPEALPPAPVGQVAVIRVVGAERVDDATIRSYLPIQQGDVVDAARLDLAVKTLYRTDLFADVDIALQGNELLVRIVENPVINQVVFEGNSALGEDKLREEIQIRPRGIYTRARVQADVQKIVELYRRSGRIAATVTPKLVELPQKRVDLVFEIDEGPKTGVRRINFLGNEAFSDNDLRDELVTKESAWWRFFSSNDNYDPDRLEYDREQLRKFYTNRGYYDFRVVSGVAELTPDQEDFHITLTVEEGPQYNFGSIQVETENKNLNPELLKAVLPIREGQLYESDRIEDATDAITFASGAAGYAFVDVRPRFTPDRESRTVDVVFQVREGPRVYVERIDIVGNTRTIDPVIRREMLLVEGDAYNRVLVDRSRMNVRRLGFFEDVEVEETPGSAPDRTVLRVSVQEQPTGELSFGAGFSSVDQFIFDLGIAERNFRGRGQNLRARVSLGSFRQEVDLSFTEPRFLGRDVRAGVDVFSSRFDFSDFTSFVNETVGASARFGFPLNQNAYLSTSYTVRQDKADFGCEGFNLNINCQQEGEFLKSILGYRLAFDYRNDALNPTRGWSASVFQDLAGVGGDVNFLKSEVQGAWYYPIRRNWVVTLSGQAGYIFGWNDDPIRVTDRFFKGGNSFRGFETAGLGPRFLQSVDATGIYDPRAFSQAQGGNAYYIGTVELAVPTPLPAQYGIRAALFADVGSLGLLDDEFKRNPDGTINANFVDALSLRASAGLSIFWKSPMGPVRFDFSQVLAKEEYDKTETFRFSTSRQF